MLGRHEAGDRRLEISDLKRFVAGADVFSRQSDGTTIAGQYVREGITLGCANTDRVNGWAESPEGTSLGPPAEKPRGEGRRDRNKVNTKPTPPPQPPEDGATCKPGKGVRAWALRPASDATMPGPGEGPQPGLRAGSGTKGTLGETGAVALHRHCGLAA